MLLRYHRYQTDEFGTSIGLLSRTPYIPFREFPNPYLGEFINSKMGTYDRMCQFERLYDATGKLLTWPEYQEFVSETLKAYLPKGLRGLLGY